MTEDKTKQEIVFYRGWFEKHQPKILKFINTKIGRWFFRIHGDRSSVGKNIITKVEPHAIFWTENSELKAEFRTRAKYANRLYHGLKWVWEAIHFFDMQIANKVAPQWNLGFDTLTAYPDADPETNTVDGSVQRIGTGNWSSFTTGFGTTADSTTNPALFAKYRSTTTASQWQILARSIFTFDTSSIGAGGTVLSGVLSVYGASKSCGFTAKPSVTIASSLPGTANTLVPSDYEAIGSTRRGDILTYDELTTSGYNNFNLNTAGRSQVNVTGVSNFAGRSSFDINNISPIWESDKTFEFFYYSAENSGTYNDPKLVVTYNVPASITSSIDYVIGNDIPLVIQNAPNYYLKLEAYINGVGVLTRSIGQTTSYTIVPTSGEIADMYAEMPNSTTSSSFTYITVRSYSDSGYTTEVGSGKNKNGVVTINTAINAPIFANYALSNVDKSVAVLDKYGNTLTTSSTQTLLGASTDRFIKGYSKVRATITTSDKMVPQNSATGSKYKFTNASQFSESAFSDVSTVNIDIDNVTVNSFGVSAFDSRNLSTNVNKTMSLMADYSIVQLYSAGMLRDNNVDAPTKLSFSGILWKKYFSSNTTSNPGDGVLNSVTLKYRYKLTTETWASQTWTDITSNASIDSNGNITFDDYVDGDLGAGGFSQTKSFDIEILAYDKLSSTIINAVVNKGDPVFDMVQEGVSVKAIYDPTEGGSLQVDGQNIYKSIKAENVLINGDFDFAQRTGARGLTPATVEYTLDRWRSYIYNGGSGTLPSVTISQQTHTPGDIYGARNHMRINSSGAGSSLAVGHFGLVEQFVENGVAKLGGTSKYVTLSFWAKSSISNKKIGVTLHLDYGTTGSADTDINGITFDLTSSWQYFTHTFELTDISAKTITADNSMWLRFFYAWGSNFNTLLGTASAQTYLGSGNTDISQVRLVAGKVALPAEFVPTEVEFAKCRRYYEKSYDVTVTPATPSTNGNIRFNNAITGTSHREYVKFATPKRISPIVLKIYSPDSGAIDKFRDVSAGVDRDALFTTPGESGFTFYPGASVNAGNDCGFHWIADSDFY